MNEVISTPNIPKTVIINKTFKRPSTIPDKNGFNDKGKPVFIPNETLNAFNKTFSEEINIKNWTKEDGDNYVAAIQERLKDFLPKELIKTTPKV